MRKFNGFECGMGIGGWLTNYKRVHVIPREKINTMTIGDEEHFRTYISENDIAYIASLGFDHVRLCFDQIVLQTEEGAFREDHFALIDAFIGWCEKYSLNIVLNLHKAFGNYCDVNTGVSLFEDEALQDEFVAFWEHFARRYAAKPALIFELLNEVRDVPPEQWNNLARKTVAAIRRIDPMRRLIVGTTCWNSPDTLKDLVLFDDEKVIYTFHFYEPFEFTHQQGVLQPATEFYNREMPYPGDIERYRDYQKCVKGIDHAYAGLDRMDKRFIDRALAPVRTFQQQHPDKTVWCGEFGTIRHCRLQWRINWFRDVIAFFKANAVPYSVWNYLSMPSDGNRFSLVDDETRKILSEDLLNTLLGKG